MNSLVEVLKLRVISMLQEYMEVSGRKMFRNYSPRFFVEKKLKGNDYFVLFETSSRCNGEVLFVSSKFQKIPVDISTFSKSIKFKCFWRATGRGRWNEVHLKPQFLGELSKVVDVQKVELDLEEASFKRT
ncbi:hypothetical protein [Solidesulfovibrio magneticus]|uniref:Uncharacterized protein n=1 Tax=Solidesulfovibrio magneticus (strain ATCC 700980 / DSM 13731 / RS-1) TaxID=573370 RepID=C4XK28_SOLM1|nr:hypothetical protein [Solidesulfovibrio magneticus]BAH74383.1 hypothetical protein DMR_08920 [Solidesulfovibrio magneticus RS-1]